MAMLAGEEGERRSIYFDSLGVPTIGFGHNLHKPLPHYIIELILESDIDDALADLDRALPWWRELDEVRQRVMADMAYNLGIDRLLKFKVTLRAIREGRWADAADGMLRSLWAKQVKGRAVKLAKMMETGQDPEPK